MWEPGLDRHDWESRMQQLEPELADDPYSSLPELADLVEEMLKGSGYAATDEVARSGEDPEVVNEFESARETANQVERGADGVSPGDVAAAINNLRSLYEFLIAERRAP